MSRPAKLEPSRQAELGRYIDRLQRRLRVAASLRGTAVLAAVALVATVALVVALNRRAFPTQTVAEARWLLIGLLAVSAAVGLVWPLLRITRGLAVRRAERLHPELEDRLTTVYEQQKKPGDANPFVELLAADTLSRAENAPPSSLAPAGSLAAFFATGLACAGGLLWMIAAGPGYLGYGASLLWTGPKPHVDPLYALAVEPGNVAVRRNTDQRIGAEVTGLHPDKVQLFARYGGVGAWEPATMTPDPAQQGARASYQFLLAGLPQDVEYYVAAGPLTSPHYKVRVVDLPSVKAIEVTYHYPAWTGMKPVTEEHSGDLRALEGTEAEVDLQTDKPLKDGQLTLDDGRVLKLKAGADNHYTATVHMAKDGAYHLAATDSGDQVRMSEDYFIATDKAEAPVVALNRPGRDYRASPIEEVTVGVHAEGEFGLRDMHLHYSVNGGPDKDISLLKAPGAKAADGTYTVHLEDFKLVPGDLVSLYATARDGHAETRTDISFIQADPFEREFSQSQQSGGGGGGGGGQQNDQTEISKREKELIAQTWKQANDKAATPKDAAAQGQFLADAQNKLRDQVQALQIRMESRDLSSANEEFNSFGRDMQQAAQAMAPSSDKLKGMAWKDALPLEQKALQALLRAEATFRQIQVAFGQQQGGGGGGGGGAGRDLASLFDLELDTAKNQYETAQTASPAEQHAKEVEDALAKLDALTKRQEELASAQHNPQQSFQDRWQQEMLRREAEQLQRQMEQMAQDAKKAQGQQGGEQGSQGQQSGQQQGSQGGQQGSPSGQSGAQGGSQSGSQGGSQSAGSAGGSQAGGQSGAGSSAQSSGAQGSAAGGSQSAQAGGAKGAAGKRQPSSDTGAGSEQRIQQALSRLREANEAMRRSGAAAASSPGAGQNGAAQQAADRLREATSALGTEQHQIATGGVDSLAREADRLVQQEHAQADAVNQLVKNGQSASSMDAEAINGLIRERNRQAAERQQLSNDLSGLQRKLRDTARSMAPNQPATAQKLRDALTAMDGSDLDNQVQRTADWLRRGVNPNSNGTEAGIAQGLQKLDQQLHQAQSGVAQEASAGDRGRGGKAGAAAGAGDPTAALRQVERLREQIQAMGSQPGGQQGGQPGSGAAPQGQNGRGQGGGSPRDGSALARNGSQPWRNGQQGGGQAGQPGGGGQPGSAQARNGSPQGGSGAQPGSGRGGAQGSQQGDGRQGGQGSGGGGALARNGQPNGGDSSGDTRFGGGGGNGTAWGNVNTGANQYGSGGARPAPKDASGNPADTQRQVEQYQQGMRQLSALRGGLGSDPQAAKELQALTREMQRLDPSRFPGNPAMVEQMHQEVLSAVDRLELKLNSTGETEAHTGKPDAIPAGYGDSVADYYKRLSTQGHAKP